MVEVYGDDGIVWLQRLPGIIDMCARRWKLTVQPPFEPLSYNYVAPVRCADGTDAVLKIGYPNSELLSEINALQLYGGNGMVNLLHADIEQGAFLLERLLPGTPLSTLEDDEQATSIAAGTMRQLWRPVPDDHPFPTVEKWALGLKRLRTQFDGGCGPYPVDLVERAEALFAELLPSMGKRVLLHGDLHHENIVMARRRPWLALDPKGVVGESAYEVGALLRNPIPGLLARSNPAQITARRVDQLAEELDIDRQRIVGWGLAQAVLSAWWSFEDHGHGWDWAINCARLLEPLL